MIRLRNAIAPVLVDTSRARVVTMAIGVMTVTVREVPSGIVAVLNVLMNIIVPTMLMQVLREGGRSRQHHQQGKRIKNSRLVYSFTLC